MICEEKVKSYCCEDIKAIENYDKAVADDTQTWHCHHRRETIYTQDELKEIGEYYNRPAMELIFLTPTQHVQLHRIGKPHPQLKLRGRKRPKEVVAKISKALRGRHHSEETIQKLRISHLGKHPTEETRRKMSQSQRGRTVSEEWKRKISEGRDRYWANKRGSAHNN